MYWWTLGLLPYLVYCKYCYNKDRGAYIFSNEYFHFPWVNKYPVVESLDPMVFVFLIRWGPSIVAFTVVIPIYIPWPVYKGCFPSTPWATLVDSCVLTLSHSDRCEVRSHRGNVYTFHFQPFQSIVCLSHLVMETQTGSFLEISQVRRGWGQIENRKLFLKQGPNCERPVLWKP